MFAGPTLCSVSIILDLFIITYYVIVQHLFSIKNMVLTFRVSELQLLLGLTSQSRCGRKTELMQRALALVERGVSTQVQLKIHELYQRFTPRSAGYSPPPAQRASMASSSSLSLPKTATMMPSQHATMSSSSTVGKFKIYYILSV